MPDGGNINIATFNTTADALKGRPFSVVSGQYVAIEFGDTGIGINADDITKIFEPFFTTKAGKGTGLGLASSFGIVKAHNGYVDVTSQKGSGTTFTVFLPAVKAATAAKPEDQSPATAHTGHGRILIVDDEIMILETNEQLLRRLGYDVLMSSSGEKALTILQNHINTIDLVIIDMIMPGMSGKELFDRIKALYPDLKTLLCSGYSLNLNAQEIMSQGCNGFIQKPFNFNQLSRTIKNILQPERMIE
jgi:CheY-like chemotaxis protein